MAQWRPAARGGRACRQGRAVVWRGVVEAGAWAGATRTNLSPCRNSVLKRVKKASMMARNRVLLWWIASRATLMWLSGNPATDSLACCSDSTACRTPRHRRNPRQRPRPLPSGSATCHHGEAGTIHTRLARGGKPGRQVAGAAPRRQRGTARAAGVGVATGRQGVAGGTGGRLWPTRNTEHGSTEADLFKR